MTGNATDNLWYIAREGQQHGPISDTEMQLFVSNGHLRATDLLWRPGFADWRPAANVFSGQVAGDAPLVAPNDTGADAPAGEAAERGAPAGGSTGAGEPRAQATGGTEARTPAGPSSGAAMQTQSAPAAAAGPAGTNMGAAMGASAAGGASGAGATRAAAPYPTTVATAQSAQQAQAPRPATGRPGPQSAAHAQAQQRPAPRANPSPAAPFEPTPVSAPAAAPRSGRGMRMALSVALVALIGGSGAYLFMNKDAILAMAGLADEKKKAVPVIKAPAAKPPAQTAAIQAPKPAAAPPKPPAPAAVAPPAAPAEPAAAGAPGAAAAAPEAATKTAATQAAITPTATAPVDATEAIDGYYQKSKLWQYMKRSHPDWYSQRLTQAAALGGGGSPPRDATKLMIEGLVGLRREHAETALQADTGRLKAIASAFLNNIQSMSESGPETCYSFISQGEASPKSVDLFHKPQSAPALEAQSIAIFEAIAAGKASPSKHERPKKGDYDVLAAELGKLGWSQADLQLFADPKALASAPPARVCSMVRDWFKAHIAITDAAVQERLLFETLRPVVSG